MSKYAEYDAKLLKLVCDGCNTFDVLANRLRDDNDMLCPQADSWRVTDRRLQALRRQGHIYFSRERNAWFLNRQTPT